MQMGWSYSSSDSHNVNWYYFLFFRYVFPCKDWIPIYERIVKKYGTVLDVKKVEESQVAVVRSKLNH